MGKQVTVLSHFHAVMLPAVVGVVRYGQYAQTVGLKPYKSNDVTTLTDTEYGALPASTLRGLATPPATVADPVRPTGATANTGAPGTYNSGWFNPFNLGYLNPKDVNNNPLTSPVIANPITAWAAGQYIILGDGSWAACNGSGGWVAVLTATAGAPGTFTCGALVGAAVSPPLHFANLSTKVLASPTTKWTTGQYVSLGDGTQAYWNATVWATGAAP
jgi:hypothetical protein